MMSYFITLAYNIKTVHQLELHMSKTLEVSGVSQTPAKSSVKQTPSSIL